MDLLDGKTVANNILDNCKNEIKSFGKKLKLVVILVGENESSKIYVNIKKKRCEEVGIDCELKRYPEDVDEQVIIDEIDSLNSDEKVTAIMIQLPLPKHLNNRKILDSINLKKDVEGLSSYYLGQILIDNEKVIPCTPKGILELLSNYKIDLEGKKVCMIGYSDIVGKPLGALCLNRGATVTQCHIKTKNLKEHTLKADIILTATGYAGLIKRDMVKVDCVIVDIGISRKGNKIVGDVDFENVKDLCSYITPVPGGVGPMTVAMLIENVIEISKKQ